MSHRTAGMKTGAGTETGTEIASGAGIIEAESVATRTLASRVAEAGATATTDETPEIIAGGDDGASTPSAGSTL